MTKKDSEKAINVFLESVTETLKSESNLSLIGFGHFQVKQRAAREGRNPNTGKVIKIAGKKVVSFKASKNLKESVN